MLICYIKIVDIVLLRIIFRGIGAYTQSVCLLFNLVRLGVHFREHSLKWTDQAGTFMSLKCVVYYANYRSWHQSSKIQVVS